MRRLHYSGSYVLTSDEVSRAVLRYARALADTHTSDVVSIPILEEGGSHGSAHFLIGPASQLYSTPVSEPIHEINDPELVEELQRRTNRLQPSVAEWPDMMHTEDAGYGEEDF
ncbi:hypothetical protein QSU92_07130 [Microbacterium sp. ET2]|uniref:hypothetical protein n=1 Tax=Microbacterium albipurpureum TaxID=3050384 RepID=UPI00259C6C86|nr:hypothetical protein [Microbacterium sp. ET2 (Ac-2212)]WJL96932.1 hypothetical protein QSU92_07130 [Microbacterium sp. ET2 (Ac-2212)]